MGEHRSLSLAKGALGAAETAIMGVAGAAPAYSIAATTAALVAVAGGSSVGALLYCGLIMFGIVFAYARLGEAMPNAGGIFHWVGQVFGSGWGFMAVWGMLTASVMFTVSATVPAAQATLELVAPHLAASTGWVAITGALWYSAITIITARGIKQASYLQIGFTIIEAVVIVAVVVAAFRVYRQAPAHALSFDWISPFAFTPTSFAAAALVATFFYWGWDVTANLAEETSDDHPRPEVRGVIWAMISLILFFVLMMTVVLIVLSDEEIAASDTSVLFAVANKLFPAPFSYLAVISTLLSTIGTIETQVLQVARSIFAMARSGMLNARYAIVHEKWNTPINATIWQWVLGVGLLFASSFFPSVASIMESSINGIGIQICFYMGLAGFASAWYFRADLKRAPMAALTSVIWPFLAALFMVFIALWSLPDFDAITTAIGIGGLLLGLVPLALSRISAKPGTALEA